MTTPLSDERLREIRARCEWEYALHAGQPRNEERRTILFLVGASIDLLAEVERLRMALEAAKPKRPNYGPGTIWTHEGPPPEVWWAEKEATNDDATE